MTGTYHAIFVFSMSTTSAALKVKIVKQSYDENCRFRLSKIILNAGNRDLYYNGRISSGLPVRVPAPSNISTEQ
jgi:hypothetical protein